jgi:hypothetical protein
MSIFKDYAENYSHIRMERVDGVLEITLHATVRLLNGAGGPTPNWGPPFTTSAEIAKTNSSL